MADGVKKEVQDDIDWKVHFEDFLDVSASERLRAETRRDYRDLKQWTDEEVSVLEARGQSAIVFDQFGKKVDSLVGMEIQRRTDPKAYPLKPSYEKASDVITQALRYIESSTFFDATATEVFEEKIVEGYGGVIIETTKDLDFEINQVPWDRFYYDPFSRRKDFKDAKYMGITLWLDLDDAVKINPEKEEDIKHLFNQNHSEDTTFQDRPSNWVDIKRKRIRVNQEYYNNGKDWLEVFYSGDIVIKGPKPSPYQNDKGESINPIEMESDYVDRENNRYGYTQRLIDPQDEINHRRSKALYMLSSVSVLAERGQFGDMTREDVLNELRKGMSFVEYNSIGGNPPVIDRQQELGQAQLAFYQDALQAMDTVGINAELSGRTDAAVSGRAFLARQQSGMTEIARSSSIHSEWKTRVYRQIWYRIKQFWTEEKWIRVTEDDNAMRFVGINVPITAAEKELEEKSKKTIDQLRAINREAVDQFIQESIAQNPLLGRVVETRNNVVELEMDITVEEAPDTISLQHEQFETLSQLAGTRADPKMFEALIMLSSMPNKDKVLEMLNGNDDEAKKAQAQAQQQMTQVQMDQIMATIENMRANTAKTAAQAQETMSKIPLNEAMTKDEIASAMERIHNVSQVQMPEMGQLPNQ